MVRMGEREVAKSARICLDSGAFYFIMVGEWGVSKLGTFASGRRAPCAARWFQSMARTRAAAVSKAFC